MNQNYEPITICNVKRAIVLTFLGKAEIVYTQFGKRVQTVYKNFDCPSIVRLSLFVRVPYKKIIFSRKNILRRDSHKCLYCGSTINLTVDHVIPKSRGGEDCWENLVTACVKCNNKKGSRTPEEARMTLKHTPKNHHT